MFRGFNLSLTKDFFINREKSYTEYQTIGKNHLKDQCAAYQKDLKSYVQKGKINGTKIQREWFPPIEAHIFLSHSHNDKDLACALAGWLYDTFDLKCFIDSTVWGYSNNLLRIMNDTLSHKRETPIEGVIYDYNSANRVSQHVNTMLSIALQKMIDQTEAAILLNTSNSVTVHSEDTMNHTYSPWIYSELICTEIVRKKPLIAYRDYDIALNRGESALNESNSLIKNQIFYEISLAHLIKLSDRELNAWKKRYSFYFFDESYDFLTYPLDALYYDVCPEELKKAITLAAALSPEEIDRLKAYYSGAIFGPQNENHREWDHMGQEKSWIESMCQVLMESGEIR